MKRARILSLPAVLALVAASCSNDPLTPTGPYVAPVYRPEVQSLNAPLELICGAGDGVYAVGPALLRHDPSGWKPVPVPPDATRQARFAVGLEDGAMAVMDMEGNTFILDDGTWTDVPAPPDWPTGFWGTATDNLYALTFGGLFGFDGSTWDSLPVPKLWEITNLACIDGQLALCGRFGRVDRFDGVQWTSSYLDSSTNYYSIAITPSGKVFVADDSRIYEVGGGTLVPILEQEIWEPELLTDGESLFAVGSTAATYNSYAIGRYTGGQWSQLTGTETHLYDCWVDDGNIFAIGANNTVWQGTMSGGSWTQLQPDHGEIYQAVAIGDAIYTIGEKAYRYLDDTWTDLDKEYITTLPGNDIDGRRPDDIWVVGRQMVLHYDGRSWQWVNSGLEENLQSVCVESNGDVIAVGRGPVIVEYDGKDWTKRELPFYAYGLTDVIELGGTIFAVGDNGLAAIRTWGHWYLMQPTRAAFTGIWGTDEKHVYAITDEQNVFYFYDGNRWDRRVIEDPALPGMVSIWGMSASHIFVLDRNGTLARFDGVHWSEEQRVFMEGMLTVCGNRRDVLTAGYPGAAIYRR
jgi:hypothetical protein